MFTCLFFNYVVIPGGSRNSSNNNCWFISGLFVGFLSSVIELLIGSFGYETVLEIDTSTTDNHGVINVIYYPRSAALTTAVVDGFLYDYNGFNFCLIAGLRAENNSESELGAEVSIPSDNCFEREEREREYNKVYQVQLVQYHIQHHNQHPQKKEVEYYYCCDLI